MNQSIGKEILQHVGVAVLLVDSKSLEIRYANRQMVELAAYSPEEILSMKISDFFANEEKIRIHNLFSLQATNSDFPLTDNDFQLLRKSRRKVPVSLSASQVVNEPMHLVTVQDNSLIKNAEWQLANAQSRLVESAKFKALGEMAGGIAHEINNPLAIISGLSQSLFDTEDLSEIHGIAERIDSTVIRMSKIVSGLKKISRDHSTDEYTEISLREVVDETLEFCKERFRNHEIVLNVDAIPRDMVITGQQTQLSQTLLNLLNNAFDAVISLPEKWISIEFAKTDTNYQLTISDSGHGINPRLHDKIMQPFFTSKEIGQGTGLGLSISKSIIEDHGGSLALDKAAKNTKFIITLPFPENFSTNPGRIAKQPVEDSENHSVFNSQPDVIFENYKPTILIVDDESEIAALLQSKLQKRGFQTVIASCGQDAIKVIENQYIDAVLSDIRMPKGDGYWLLKRLNRLSFNIPLIFVTGSVTIALEEAYNLGASAVFFKPINFPALIDTILQVVTPREQKWSRRVLRVDTELRVNVSREGTDQLQENMINLGTGGMFVASNDNMPRNGETVHFEFTSSLYPDRPIRGSGIVRWVRKSTQDGSPTGYGIEFVYIDDQSMQPLIELINSICTHSYIPNS